MITKRVNKFYFDTAEIGGLLISLLLDKLQNYDRGLQSTCLGYCHKEFNNHNTF